MQRNGFEVFELILSTVIHCFKWIVLGAAILVLLSGVYKVDRGECAVVLRFGRLVGDSAETQVKQPGLHFALPSMIDEVIKIPVEKVLETEVTTHYGSTETIDPDVTQNGYIITGDQNLVLIDAKIKYRVSDPVTYALYVGQIDGIMNGLVSSELNALASGMGIDSILTAERANLADSLLENIQTFLEENNYGIMLTNVEFVDIVPPGETKAYFDAVNSAEVGKQTLIQEANDYRTQTILEAEGQADEAVNRALVDQSSRLSEANDEMAEFQGLYEEYVMNPQVVLDGVFRERASDILTEMGATVVVPQDGTPILYLP